MQGTRVAELAVRSAVTALRTISKIPRELVVAQEDIQIDNAQCFEEVQRLYYRFKPNL